jgi:hypothetical protein
MCSIDGGPAVTLNGSHLSFQAQSTRTLHSRAHADTSFPRYQPQ